MPASESESLTQYCYCLPVYYVSCKFGQCLCSQDKFCPNKEIISSTAGFFFSDSGQILKNTSWVIVGEGAKPKNHKQNNNR